MFAIISYKNNQYKVSEGTTINLPMSDYDDKNKKIIFDSVLLVSDDKKTEIGKPEIKNAKVEGEILETGRTDKVRILKFRAKKRYKRTAGSRSSYLKVQINKIESK
ncbi:MAG: 50S ribosomal protein L21 [Patescibacteria group bacterium]|jgi:large subunit ribosomal protein L21